MIAGFRLRRDSLALSLAALVYVPSAHADLLTYENARFGTRITFPAELFDMRMEPPTNHDGMTWTASDGGSIAVYASNNALMIDETGLLRQVRDSVAGITYDAKGKGWVVVSGIEDDMAYYQRWEFGPDEVIHSALLRYPVTMSDRYSPLVKSIMDTLQTP